MACPICKSPTDATYRPFCSRRCADVDLARWLNGAYAVPAEEEDRPDADDYASSADAGGGSGRDAEKP